MIIGLFTKIENNNSGKNENFLWSDDNFTFNKFTSLSWHSCEVSNLLISIVGLIERPYTVYIVSQTEIVENDKTLEEVTDWNFNEFGEPELFSGDLFPVGLSSNT